MDRLRRGIDWAFRNRRTGLITVGQWPNFTLSIFLAAKVVEWLATPGRIGDVAAVVAFLGLLAWAADELLRGVNPWRRALGAAVLVILAADRLR